MPPTLRLCMLNADTPVPALHSTLATTYGQIFHGLLSSAASSSSLVPNLSIQSRDFNVVQGEYPSSLSDFDAIIISGSANSAYDDLAWVQRLERYISHVYYTEPRVKIFGSCFGHQIVGGSLLGECGVGVEMDPQGWEVGVHPITLSPEFRHAFKSSLKSSERKEVETIRLQFVHHDHVVIPNLADLPAGWMVLGSTQHCAVQGLYQPRRVLTTQGHFEFDRVINSETAKYFFPDWAPEVMEKTLRAIDKDDDSVLVASMVLSFFMEGRDGDGSAARELTAQPVRGTCRDECEQAEQAVATVITH